MAEQDSKSFNHEFSQLTRLAVAQLIVAVNDADDSMNELTESFTNVVEQNLNLQNLLKQLPVNAETEGLRDQIQETGSGMSQNIQSAIIAFQFFDRMCQRMEHTILCLKELSNVEDGDLADMASQTKALFEKIYNSYTMEEERLLYDEILRHPDFEAALAHYRKASKRTDQDIELF